MAPTWSDPTFRFGCMVGVILTSALAGYVARKGRLCREEASERITFVTLVYGYPVASLLPVWTLAISWKDAWLPVQCLLLTFVGLGIGLAGARLHRMAPRDAGAYSYAAAHTNMGFTMGGFVCLALFGEQGLALTLIYAVLWTIAMFGFFFPLAGAFAGQKVQLGVGRFVRALFDIRNLSLLAILVGLALNGLGVRRPEWVDHFRIVDIFVVVCSGAMFFVIGLTLHLSQVRRYALACVSLSAIKFVALPIAAAGLIAAAQAAGLGLDSLRVNVMMVESAMPTALFAVVAANLYGLNARLASLLFVSNTGMFLALVLPVIRLIYAAG